MVIADFGCAHSNDTQQRHAEENGPAEIGTRYQRSKMLT